MNYYEMQTFLFKKGSDRKEFKNENINAHTKNNVPAECMSKISVEDCINVYEPDYPEAWLIIARYHVLCYSITSELSLSKREAI
jgi:hypothetical protein